MFPPLCFTDFGKKVDTSLESIEEKLKEVLTEQEIQLIKTNRGYSQIKFKSIIAEIIQGLVKNDK